MEKFAQGTDVILDIYMYDREGGSLVDPDGYDASEPTITVIDQNGLTKVSAELVSQDYADGTGRITQGHYSYKYTLANDAPIGTQWRYIWGLTINGVAIPEAERTEYFEVVEAGYVSFAGYITIQEIRDFLAIFNIDSTDLTDEFIANQINKHIEAVEKQVNKSLFTLKTETIILHGEGSPNLMLPNYSIYSIDEIKILYGDEYETTISPDDYVLNSKNGELTIKRDIILSEGDIIDRFPYYWDNIEVTYTHGYQQANNDVKMAIINLIAASCLALYGASVSAGSYKSLSIEGYSKTLDSDDVSYRNLIDDFRSEAKNIIKLYQ